MIKALRPCLIALLLSGFAPVVHAQNIEGQIIAAQYAGWRVEGQRTDTYKFVAQSCSQQAGRQTFTAFAVGTPVKIFDADPSQNEVVTPTAVEANNQGCTVTIAPAHTHSSFRLGSATAGLQEALNANLGAPNLNTVVLTAEWYNAGGSADVIAAAQGSTSLNLVDITKAPYDWYTWSGTQYTKVSVGGDGTLPDALVKGNGPGNPATAALPADVVEPFKTTQTIPNVVLNTTFNEGTAGSTIAGTVPAVFRGTGTWQFGDSSTVANFNSGGGMVLPSQSTNPTGGPFIDVGVADYVVQASFAPAGGYSMLMLRYQDELNLTFMNIDNGTAQVFDYIGGAVVSLGDLGGFSSANFTVTTSGTSYTFNDGVHTPVTLTSTRPATATKIGVTLENGGPLVVNSLKVTAGMRTIHTSCPVGLGFLSPDGYCYFIGVGQTVFGGDGQGNLANMPEKGTTFDGSQDFVAWDEDYSAGIFDARNPKYAGGLYGPTPGAALQSMANAMACYMHDTNEPARTTIPSGSFRVGTSDAPSLHFASGGYYLGTGNPRGAGTNFQGTFNNVPAVIISPLSVTCHGTTVTVGLDGGEWGNFSETGCGQGGCNNIPGDTADHPNGGPGQTGISIYDSHAVGHDVAAFHNGGTGLNWAGLDSTFHGYFAVLNNEWYLFGHNVPGQTYDPTTDGQHGDFDFENLDARAWDLEIYGTGNEPGTESGHVCLLVHGGGNSSVSNFFLQLGEIGYCRPFNSGEFARASDFRIDFSRLVGLQIRDNSISYQNGFIDGSCLAANAIADMGGYCTNIDQRGNGSFFTNMQLTDAGFGGAPHLTGQVYPVAGGSFRQMNFKNADGLPQYQVVGGNQRGQGIDREWSPGFYTQSCAALNGELADHFILQDTSPTNCPTLPNAYIGHTYVFAVPEGATVFDTLLSPANGGHWHSADGQNVVLNHPGFYIFTVISGTDGGGPAELQEVSRPVDLSSLQINQGALGTPPSIETVAAVDAVGDIQARPVPFIADPIIEIGPNGLTSFTYCAVVKMWLGAGIQTSNLICDPHTPPVTSSGLQKFGVDFFLPAGWTKWEVYLNSTTDPSYTNIGLVGTGTSGPSPGHYTGVQYFVTNNPPINTTTIASYNIHVNFTGAFESTATHPTHGANFCRRGQTIIDPTASTGGIYYCDSDNHWMFGPITFAALP